MLRRRCRGFCEKTKYSLEAILLVSGYEIFDSEADRHPKIIHHAVERSKQLVNRFEQGFLNAILRKLPFGARRFKAQKSPAAFYSHPDWLVERWQRISLGPARKYKWNQGIPPTLSEVLT